MSDPAPSVSRPEDELDQAVDAVEHHQQAEEDADPNEQVVVRDPESGRTTEEPAQ